MVVDSINKNGCAYYSELLRKYCDVDTATVKALPRLRFQHAANPKQSDIIKAIK